MQNMFDILLLFCIPTWLPHHVSENTLYTSLGTFRPADKVSLNSYPSRKSDQFETDPKINILMFKNLVHLDAYLLLLEW